MRKLIYLIELNHSGLEWEPELIISTYPDHMEMLIESIINGEGPVVYQFLTKHDIRYRHIDEEEFNSFSDTDIKIWWFPIKVYTGPQ